MTIACEHCGGHSGVRKVEKLDSNLRPRYKRLCSPCARRMRYTVPLERLLGSGQTVLRINRGQ